MAMTPSEKKKKFRDSTNFGQKLRAQQNWDKYVYKITDFVSKRDLKPSKVAIGIAAATRPEYLERTLQAIAANPESSEWPTFTFLDAHPDGRQAYATDRQEEMIHEYLPECVIIRRPVNFGCGRSIIDLRRQLFDVLGYKRVFVMEDDCLITRNYFKYCMSLMDWAEETFSNVGAVQGHNICHMQASDKPKHLHEVLATSTNWWAYLMSKKCWDSMRDLIYTFENKFLTALDYSHRPHNAIREWFRTVLHEGQEERGVKKRRFQENSWSLERRAAYFDDPPTGQDAATMISFYLRGWFRLAPVVNRSYYIGKRGIHYNPSAYAKDRWGQMEMATYDSDADITEFETFAEDPSSLVPPPNPKGDLEGLVMINNMQG
jgi:hypothetical protein